MTSSLLICAALLTLAWLFAAQRRLVAHLARRFLALPRLHQVALVLAVGVMTVCAQKSGTNENAVIELSNNRIGGSFGIWFCYLTRRHGDTEWGNNRMVE